MLQSYNNLVCTHLAAVYRNFKRTGTTDAIDAVFRGHDQELTYKRDAILSALAVEEARSGEGQEARRIAGTIEDARQKAQALTAIADQRRRIDRAGALEAAHEARASIPSISVDWQRVEALGEAAAVLVRAGDLNTWTEDLEPAVAGSNDAVGARAISDVAIALAETGNGAAAREWLERLPKDNKADVTGARALALVTLGATSEGVELADSLRRSADGLELEYDIKTRALLLSRPGRS